MHNKHALFEKAKQCCPANIRFSDESLKLGLTLVCNGVSCGLPQYLKFIQ